MAKVDFGLRGYYLTFVLLSVISLASCATDTTVKPTGSETITQKNQPEKSQESTPTTPDIAKQNTPLKPDETPTISSVKQSITPDGSITFTIEGTGINSQTIVEIYSSGKLIGSAKIAGETGYKGDIQIATTKPIKGVTGEKFTIKLKNAQSSEEMEIMNQSVRVAKQDAKVVKKNAKVAKQDAKVATTQQAQSSPRPVEKCPGSYSAQPHVLYLGGGLAEKLFEQYLSNNTQLDNKKLPHDIKIKFYESEKETGGLLLRTVAMAPLERAFVESKADFLSKITALLKGRMAAVTSSLVDDAKKEKADYLQCPSQ